MIRSKEDYRLYLEQDLIALGLKKNNFLKQIFFPNYSLKLQRKLRKLEFYKNVRKNWIYKISYLFLKISYHRLCTRLNVVIPENVFGPGLAIVHHGTIIVNPNAKVGKNCRIQAGVNIGASGGQKEAPQIGDNVYLGPGVKVYGNIVIGNNCAIAANATVGKSIDEDGVMIAGVPAKVIKKIDIRNIIPYAKLILFLTILFEFFYSWS